MPSYVTPKKNTQFIFYVSLTDQANTKLFKANPTLATGDFKVSIDGGTLTDLATLPTVTPASGRMVKVTLSTSEMNGDNVTFVAVDAAGAEWCDLMVNIQTSARQVDDLAYPAVSGRSLAVDASGRALSDVDTIKTNAVVNAGTITFPTSATLASTTNITAGTITTVTTTTTATNLTNLPTIPANWLTAAGTASDFGTEVAAAIWQDAVAGDFTVASSIGKSLFTGNVVPGGSGGLLISGSNSGTTTLGALTVTGASTLTGNVSMAAGLTITQSTSNGHGITTTGNGTGHGLLATSGSGASGDGIAGIAASTGGNGISAQGGATNGVGLRATGGGTGFGIFAVAGTGGSAHAVAIQCSGAGGNGIDVNAGAGHGINILAAGNTKHGILSTGGSAGTSDGIRAVAGTGGVDLRANITGNVTGNLSGSAGSVTGAVGSVTAAVAITSNIKQNQALAAFEFLMTDSTLHNPSTGLTVTVTRSIDGGAFGAGSLSAVTEVSNGIYKVDFAASDLNGKVIVLRATATASDDTFERIVTQV